MAVVIRFKLAALLKKKGWTPYRLAKETGLTIPSAYRLVSEEPPLSVFKASTLDLLCKALGVQPGQLLEYVPDEKRKR